LVSTVAPLIFAVVTVADDELAPFDELPPDVEEELFEPPLGELLPQAATVSIPAAKIPVTHHRLDIVISISHRKRCTRGTYGALHANVTYNQTTYRVA
jgi:hypothetical protein